MDAKYQINRLNINQHRLSKFLILFLLAISISNCRELVTDNFPDFENRTTVNSILTADSVVEIHVSRAEKVDQTELSVIENAQVQLLINGIEIEVLSYDSDGKYRSLHKVIAGSEYECIVETDLLPQVSAKCKIPVPTSLNEVILFEEAWVNDESWLCPAIQFSIDNPQDELRYYNARIKVINFSSPIVEDISLALFSNEFEPSQTITKYFEFDHDNILFSQFAYILELRSLSFDLYEYMKSLEEYQKGRYPEFDSGSIVPQNLHNNVEGGYGIFAGYSSCLSDTL